MNLKVSYETIKRELTDEEGYRLVVYRCTAGYPTVGIGHNLAADPALHILGRKLKVKDMVTDAQVDKLFRYDLDGVLDDIERNFPWFSDLNAARQYVIISLVFNMGILTVLSFKNTLAALNRGDYEAAARGLQNSKWHGQVGRRGPKLVKVMRTGKF